MARVAILAVAPKVREPRARVGRVTVVLLATAFLSLPAGAQDHVRAPVAGAVDGRVTQETIQRTICQRGYMAHVRPPRQFTDDVKRQLINGHPGPPQDYELDHLVPLSLGGHPTSANNLWLQPWGEAAMKDREEARLHREVCAGRMTLEQAQREMVATWGRH